MTANNLPTVDQIRRRCLDDNGRDRLGNQYLECECFLTGFAVADPNGDEVMLIVATKGDTDDRE